MPTALQHVLLIEPNVLRDPRGALFESWHAERYRDVGAPLTPLVETHTTSLQGTLRGLHYQLHHAQAKLVRVVTGDIVDVAVDIRRTSPTFGRWIAIPLSAGGGQQLYIPAGFAHGFCVPTVDSEVEIKYSSYHDPEDSHGIIWNDPTLGIDWPVRSPILSDRDAHLRPLEEGVR